MTRPFLTLAADGRATLARRVGELTDAELTHGLAVIGAAIGTTEGVIADLERTAAGLAAELTLRTELDQAAAVTR